MIKAIQFSQPSHGRGNGLTLHAISLLLSVVVFIAGCQNGGQDEPDEPTDEGGAQVELEEPTDEGRAENEPDDPTDVGGAEKAASCPPVIFTDVSCYPRGNASDPVMEIGKGTALARCRHHRDQCLGLQIPFAQTREYFANDAKCIEVGCRVIINDFELTQCRPTNPGQPCFFRPSTEMHECSYMAFVNFTEYACVVPDQEEDEGEEGEPM